MFCEECGSKLENGSSFCENCGAKVIEESSSNAVEENNFKGKVKMERKPFKLTLPMIIGGVVVLILIIILIISMQFSPKATVEKYMKCIKDNSACFVKYLDVKENEYFKISEINKYISENKIDNAISKYSILGSRKLGQNGYKVKVKIYPVDTKEQPIETELDVMKSKQKNLLFFPKYIIDNNTGYITKNFTITVPKGSKVKLNGIEVKKDGKTTDDKTTYTIPYLFNKKHKVTVEYAGIETTKEVKSSYNFNGEVDINKELQNKLADKGKVIINDMYKAITASKEFDQSGLNQTFKETYNDIKKSVMKDYSTLLSFDVTKMTYKSASITSKNELKVSYTMNYNYSLKYFEKNVNSSSSRSVTLLVKLDNDKNIIDIDSLPTYFSTYSY